MFALQKIVFLFKILTSIVLLRNYGNLKELFFYLFILIPECIGKISFYSVD